MSIELEWFLKTYPKITTIEAIMPDCNGIMRGKWVPVQKLEKLIKGDAKLPKTALNLDIWGRDVEELVFETGDDDGLCVVVEGSLQATPWSPEGRYGECQLTMTNPDGSPYMGDPRQVLIAVVDKLKQAGFGVVVAAELEFSLITLEHGRPVHTGKSLPGELPIGGNLYGTDSLLENEPFLEEVRAACEIQSLPFDGVIKESAPSQYEINMKHHDDPVSAARQVLQMRRLIKGVAAKHQRIATFMPKPFPGESGNGMHLHLNLIDRNGQNVFDDGSDTGSELLSFAIAGLLKHMRDSTLIFAPHVNSYRRFEPGVHAPTYPAWGYENRTVAIRVPTGSPKARRIEHRVAGADANPYLLMAATLAAVLEGITAKSPAPQPVTGNGYAQTVEPLPIHPHEAVEIFRHSEFIATGLSPELRRHITLTKEQELAEFRRYISAMEYQTYLQY